MLLEFLCPTEYHLPYMKEILKPAYVCHMATGDHLKDLGRIQQSLPGRYLQENSLVF